MDEPLSLSEGPRPERRQERRARIAGALDRDELVGAEDVDVIAALGDDALMRDYVYACVRLGAHLGPRERAFVLRGYTLAGLDRPPLPPPSQLRAAPPWRLFLDGSRGRRAGPALTQQGAPCVAPYDARPLRSGCAIGGER